jgi:hypothetical protein
LSALGCRGRADGARGWTHGRRGRADDARGWTLSAHGCRGGGWGGNQRDGLGDVGYYTGVLADMGSADTSQVGESSLNLHGVGGP